MGRAIARVLLLGWAVVVLAVTLAANTTGGQRDEGAGTRRTESATSDIVGNIALFVPVGALALAAFPHRRRLVFLAGPALSATVELYQAAFLPTRYPSVRDVATNSVGHLAGMGIAALMMRPDTGSTRDRS